MLVGMEIFRIQYDLQICSRPNHTRCMVGIGVIDHRPETGQIALLHILLKLVKTSCLHNSHLGAHGMAAAAGTAAAVNFAVNNHLVPSWP